MTESPESIPFEENAYLVINTQIFPIKKRVVTIGRKFDNDLVLQDSSVSRYHAEIRFEDDKFVLVDKESASGTFLNNQKITKSVLYSGDIISFANMPIMFMNESDSISNRTDRKTGQLG